MECRQLWYRKSVCWGGGGLRKDIVQSLCVQGKTWFSYPITKSLFYAALISIPDGSEGWRYNCFLTVLLHLQRVVQHRTKLVTHYYIYTQYKSEHQRKYFPHFRLTILSMLDHLQTFVKCESRNVISSAFLISTLRCEDCKVTKESIKITEPKWFWRCCQAGTWTYFLQRKRSGSDSIAILN